MIQILSNLLNNAAKFTPEGGEIVLRTEVSDIHLVFTVSDNGIGIEPAIIEEIFDMFAQAGRNSDRAQGGLGIGLALVRKLVLLHGGTVSAQSDGLGKGSCFTLTFPRNFDAHEVADTPSLPLLSAGKAQRLLIVDDNVDAGAMLGVFLELAGYQVQVVPSAAAALELAGTQEFNACLLDIGLPDMDGNELAKCLRKLPATSTAMLLAITGYGQDIDRRKSLESGFDHHLVKPVDMEKLLSTLAELAEKPTKPAA